MKNMFLAIVIGMIAITITSCAKEAPLEKPRKITAVITLVWCDYDPASGKYQRIQNPENVFPGFDTCFQKYLGDSSFRNIGRGKTQPENTFWAHDSFKGYDKYIPALQDALKEKTSNGSRGVSVSVDVQYDMIRGGQYYIEFNPTWISLHKELGRKGACCIPVRPYLHVSCLGKSTFYEIDRMGFQGCLRLRYDVSVDRVPIVSEGLN